LQCAAVCCSVLQCVAVCCSVLQCVCQIIVSLNQRDSISYTVSVNRLHYKILQHFATHCDTGYFNQLVAGTNTVAHCNTLQHTATHCNTLQNTTKHRFECPMYVGSLQVAMCCSVLQCVAVCCSVLQARFRLQCS